MTAAIAAAATAMMIILSATAPICCTKPPAWLLLNNATITPAMTATAKTAPTVVMRFACKSPKIDDPVVVIDPVFTAAAAHAVCGERTTNAAMASDTIANLCFHIYCPMCPRMVNMGIPFLS